MAAKVEGKEEKKQRINLIASDDSVITVADTAGAHSTAIAAALIKGEDLKVAATREQLTVIATYVSYPETPAKRTLQVIPGRKLGEFMGVDDAKLIGALNVTDSIAMTHIAERLGMTEFLQKVACHIAIGAITGTLGTPKEIAEYFNKMIVGKKEAPKTAAT